MHPDLKGKFLVLPQVNHSMHPAGALVGIIVPEKRVYSSSFDEFKVLCHPLRNRQKLLMPGLNAGNKLFLAFDSQM